MAIYRMKSRPAPAITSLQFGSYNAAILFAQANLGMLPSKPYKRTLWTESGLPMPTWFITFGLIKDTTPQYEKVEA